MLEITGFYTFRFVEEVFINAPASAGFAFFENMQDNYVLWHPDHIDFEWRKGCGLEVGNVFWFKEKIADKTMTKTTRITEVIPDRYFAFEMTNPLFRFFLPKLSFEFAPKDAGFVFRAELCLKGIGPLGRHLNKSEFDAVDIHMVEEGKNLKAILEHDTKIISS